MKKRGALVAVSILLVVLFVILSAGALADRLLIPTYNAQVKDVQHNFTFNSTKNNTANCTLWTNFAGSWQQNSSKKPIHIGVNNFTGSWDPSLGTYKWNVKCYNTTAGFRWINSSKNFSITFATPVNLSTPATGQSWSLAPYNFTFIDYRQLMNCSLITNLSHTWTVKNQTTGLSTGIHFFTLKSNLTLGSYKWTVNCSQGKKGFYAQVNRTFNILDITAPTVSITKPTQLQTLYKSNVVSINVTETDNFALKNCTLWEDFKGSYHRNSTKFVNGTTNTSLWTFTLPDSTYNINVSCCDKKGNCGWATTNKRFTVAYTTAPTITLNSPINSYNSSSATVVLRCTNSDTDPKNVTVWTNEGGTWHANGTQTRYSSATHNFTTVFSEGSKKWNCVACDNNSNCGKASANYTLIVDLTNPTINSVRITDADKYLRSTDTVNLTMNVSDNNAVKSTYASSSAMTHLSGALWRKASTTLAALGYTQQGTQAILFSAADYSGRIDSNNITMLSAATNKYKIQMQTKTGVLDFYAVYSDNNTFCNLGKDDNRRIVTTPATKIYTNWSFIVSTNKLSHLVQITGFDSGNTLVSFTDIGTGAAFQVSTTGNAGTIYLDGNAYNFKASYPNGYINITDATMGSDGAVLFSKNDSVVQLKDTGNDCLINITEVARANEQNKVNSIYVVLHDPGLGALQPLNVNAPTSNDANFQLQNSSNANISIGYTSFRTKVEYNIAPDQDFVKIINSAYILVKIDDTKPAVTSVVANATVTKGNRFVKVNATVVESNYSSIKLNNSVGQLTMNVVNLSASNHFATTIVNLTKYCPSQGACILNVVAIDRVGNANTTGKVTITVDDIAPKFRGVGKNVTSAIGATKPFKVFANVTDANGVKNVTVRYQSGTQLPMSLSGGNYTVVTTSQVLGITTSNTNHKLTVRACDNNGACNETNITGLNVDTAYPKISAFTSNVSLVMSTWTIIFNATVNDTNLQTVYLNYTKKSLMKNKSISYYIFNTTAQMGCSGETTCSFNIIATDSVGNVNNSVRKSINVDDLRPRVTTTTISDTDNYVTPGESVMVNATVADTNINTVTFNNVAASQVGTTTSWVLITNMTRLNCSANSACTLRINATDLLKNRNDSRTKTVYVDSTAPVITFKLPANNSNTTNKLLNFTITDMGMLNSSISVSGAGGYSVSKCKGNSTRLVCAFNTTGLVQGINTITVGITDKAGNNGTKNVIFRYDTAGPQISAGFLPTTATNINTPATTVYLTYLINDTNIGMSQAWYRIDGKATKQVLNANAHNASLGTLLAGAHSLVIYANDTLKNNNSLAMSTFYIQGLVNVTNLTNTLKKGGVKNVTFYNSTGGALTGSKYFNRTIRSIIVPNVTAARTNITINITVLGNNLIIANANKPLLDVNPGGALASIVKASAGNTPLQTFIMYSNMSYYLNASKIVDQNGIAQWVEIHIQKTIKNLSVLYFSDDRGSNIYVLSKCSNNTRPNPPSSMPGCYVNSSKYVNVYVPHLSGVGLADPNYAPSYTINVPGAKITDSLLSFSGKIYDLDLNNASCVYNLTKGASTIVGSTSLTPTLSEGSTNYSFSVSYADVTGFRNLTNGSKYNVTISCASIGNGNRSTSKTQFLVVDTTVPSTTASVAKTTTTATITITTGYEMINYTLRYWKSGSGPSVTSNSGFTTTQTASLSSLTASTTYYYNYTYCDRAKNCNTTLTTSFATDAAAATPVSGGGGGGGGLSAKMLTSTSKYWDILRAGTNSMSVATGDYGIKKLTFTVKQNVRQAMIQIERFSGKPTEVSDASGSVYKYLQIGLTKLTQEDINGTVTVAFTVTTDWLKANNVQASDIVLRRYVDSSWTDLGTKQTGTTLREVAYESQTPGFSYFAITSKGAPIAAQPAPVSTPATTETPKAEATVGTTTPATPATKPGTAQLKTEAQKTTVKKWIYTILGIVILVLAIILLVAKKKHRHSKMKIKV